jgi:hypothetical protein
VRNPTEAPEEPTKPLRGLTLEGVLEVQISDLGGLERWFFAKIAFKWPFFAFEEARTRPPRPM